MTPNGAADLPLSDGDLLDALQQLWQERDPVPVDLADRLSFALALGDLDDLDLELLHLVEEVVLPDGARAEECARTVTFTSETLSVMVTIHEEPSAIRLDGWISDGGRLRVGLRSAGVERLTLADEDGRFSFNDVTPGLAQLVFHPTEGAPVELRNPVVTPALKL